MLLKYPNCKFVNVDEVYSKNVFIGKNNIAIPYINIGLMPENPITGRQSVVNYSYYVLIGVRSMFFNGSRGKLNFDFNLPADNSCITEYIGVGGFNNDNGAEVTIVCKEAIFYLRNNSIINDPFHPFLPMDTPNYKQNMNSKEVEVFFSIDNLPNEIKEILGSNIYSLTWG